MSKQQELDGEALPVKEGFPKNQSPLLLNSIPSLPPPHSLPTPFLSPQYKTTPWCWWTQVLPEIQENLIVCRCCAVTLQYLLFWWILSQCEAREAGASLNTMRQPSPPPTGGGKSVLSFSHPPWPCLGNRWSRTITPVPWPLTHSMTWVRRRKKKKKQLLSLTPPKCSLGIFRHCHIEFNFVQTSPLHHASCSLRWGHGNDCQLLWAMPSPHEGTGGRTGSQNAVGVPVLPRHSSGPPAGSWEIWGFLPAHLWCWDLTWTHAAS